MSARKKVARAKAPVAACGPKHSTAPADREELIIQLRCSAREVSTSSVILYRAVRDIALLVDTPDLPEARAIEKRATAAFGELIVETGYMRATLERGTGEEPTDEIEVDS